MEQKTEALYLINGDRFLHLRETGAGVGFATYNCANGAPLESGQISKQNLPPDGRNAIPAARNWYLFELSSDDRKAIQEVSLQHLDTIPQSGVRRRRIWDDPTIPRDDVRLINIVRSYYNLCKARKIIVWMILLKQCILFFCCHTSRLCCHTGCSGGFNFLDRLHHFLCIWKAHLIRPPLFFDYTIVVHILQLVYRLAHDFLHRLIEISFCNLLNTLCQVLCFWL